LKFTDIVLLEGGLLGFYRKNNLNRMNYAAHINQNLSIGSGVTETACKTLVKQRLCGSGMRWKL